MNEQYILRNYSLLDLINKQIDEFTELGKRNIVLLQNAATYTARELHTSLAFKSIFKGREFHEFDRNKVAVSEENFLVLNNGQQVKCYADDDNDIESLSIYFADDFADKVLAGLTLDDDKLLDNYDHFNPQSIYFFEKLYPYSDEIKLTTEKIKKLKLQKQNSDVAIDEQLHLLMEHLLCEHRNLKSQIEKLPFAKSSTRIEIYRRLNRAKDYIDSCYSENVTLAHLAEIACMAEHHFLRHFKNAFEITPHQYITQRRLEEAKQLLKGTEKPVSMIIHMIGFECPSSFGRLFKQYTSYTPIGFRGLD
ncbi:MAG: AraC family transcriptional regulator [Bacteroidia bacterium]